MSLIQERKDLIDKLKSYQHLKRRYEELNSKMIGLSSVRIDKEVGGYSEQTINDTIMAKDEILKQMNDIEDLIALVKKEPIHTVLYLYYIEGKRIQHIELFLNYSYKYGYELKRIGELLILEKISET